MPPTGTRRFQHRAGSVLSASYTSIRVPLLKTIKHLIPPNKHHLVERLCDPRRQMGKFKRPCIAFGLGPGRGGVHDGRLHGCVLIMCTFEGATFEQIEELYRDLIVAVYPNAEGGVDAVHSDPQWKHEHNQWILLVPFTSLTSCEQMDEWRSEQMPHGARFSPETMRILRRLALEKLEAWSAKLLADPQFLQYAIRYLLDPRRNASRISLSESAAWDSTSTIASARTAYSTQGSGQRLTRNTSCPSLSGTPATVPPSPVKPLVRTRAASKPWGVPFAAVVRGFKGPLESLKEE
ncbi:hypothetical protein C8F01DRAFT_1262920 [Mycena amicta]|nr:hypothetical protein C8F01DRAFT_1262920 [Mycena amicta]